MYYYSSNRDVICMSARVVKTLTLICVINNKKNVQEVRIQLELAGTQAQEYGSISDNFQARGKVNCS